MLELTLRLVASLAVVVGLLLLLARLGGRRFRGRAGALVNVVHRQPLSRTSSIAVITVGSRVLVLGATEHQVTVLTELDPTEVSPDLVLVATADDELPPVPVALPGRLPAADAAETRAHRPGAHRAASQAYPTTGRLSGSVLSAQTWRQAFAAASGKAS